MTDAMKRCWRIALPVSGILILLMAALSAWSWTNTPADATFPVHWNMHGEVDRYGSKFEALLLAPLVSVGVALLMAFLPFIEPRRLNIERSLKAYAAVWICLMVMMTGIHFAILLSALGKKVNVALVMPLLMSGLFLVIGNYLGKVRSNFFFGIRTPWTLSSELSWNKTHRLGGWLFVLLGLVMLAMTLLAPPTVTFIVLIAGVVGVSLAAAVYSYVIWKHDPERDRPRWFMWPPKSS